MKIDKYLAELPDNLWSAETSNEAGDTLRELAKDMRDEVLLKCKEGLLKQALPMVHINGYPSDAVPKSTILSLVELVKPSIEIK